MAPTCSIFSRSILLALAMLALGVVSARGDNYLLYFEAQGVAGYASRLQTIYYSMNEDAEMQKPSLGFDYLQRFSGAAGDWGALGLQGRLALTVDEAGTERLEPQLYNAWFKVKTPVSDLWIGHNRPALGLGSYFDSHPLLLRTLPIQGFGYDRDWGLGSYRDFTWGNLQLSATTGSGMPVYFKGNYLLAARVAYGVLNEDNQTLGISVAAGQTLDTMGYELRDSEPRTLKLVGSDFAWLRNNVEQRCDLFAGEWLGESTVALMYRLGYLIGPEQRLKVELQPTYWRSDDDNWLYSICFSALATADLTVRTLYEYERNPDEHRGLLQLYYYLPL